MMTGLAVFALSGCTDKDYDLSNVDTTIGIGGDEFQIPASSTENIMLDDILDLNDGDIVKINPNGDYVLSLQGEDVDPSHPKVDPMTVDVQKVTNHRIYLNNASNTSAVRRMRKAAGRYSVKGAASSFDYSGNVPKEIVNLCEVGVSSVAKANLSFSQQLTASVSKFKTITVSLPQYMQADYTQIPDIRHTSDGNSITFYDVPTSRSIPFLININSLDFAKGQQGDDVLKFTKESHNVEGKVAMKGDIMFEGTFDEKVSSADCYAELTTNMEDITVKNATGYFDPDIDLTDLGDVNITNVPDFLKDDQVSVNVYNPLIEITASSDADVVGLVTGWLIATDENGAEMARVRVPADGENPIRLNPTSTTKVLLCKYADQVDASQYSDVRQVPTLSKIVERIPSKLRFEVDAHADKTRKSSAVLGHEYTIAPAYRVDAPLAFDKDARIVYRDTIDGWNDDIDKLSFADNSYLAFDTDVESRIPAYLSVNAFAVGTDGKALPDTDIEVAVSNGIDASPDGETASTSHLTVTLKEKAKGALKRVDGVAFRIQAASDAEGAPSIVGKTINAYKHTLVARNIRVKLVGRVVADLN